MPLERHLQKSILRHLKQLSLEAPGLLFRKRHGTAMGVAGDPDIYGLWNGHHFEIELKVPGEHPTPLQALRLGEWAKAGALTAVIHSVQELDLFLATLKAETEPY
jgi:hypothetical protein